MGYNGPMLSNIIRRGAIGKSCLPCLLLVLLVGCASPLPAAPSTTVDLTPSPSPSPTVTPTPQPTPTVTPTSTPAPTVSLGFLSAETPLTPTVTPETQITPTPTPATEIWHLPGRVVPEPFGVNIHFTRPAPGEMALMEASGIRFVRMDLFWHMVEQERGRYDFSDYDVLVAEMSARGIGIVFILDYGNDLYGGGGAAHYSDEGRAAFARFAATAVRRYLGKEIIWEIWNEPNLDKYWHAPPDPVEYAQMASTVVTAIRRVDPTAWIVGPATAGFPWDYIEALAAQGVLNRLDAVTVHPYRLEEPESAWPDYVRLRRILDRVSPDRRIPIVSGEWGYATTGTAPTEAQQARYLTRQWLFHLTSDVDLSIWYNWRNAEHDSVDESYSFSIVGQDDLQPKLAYRAAQTLIATLDGYSFRRRIPLGSTEDYLLLFHREGRTALAAWTTARPHEVTLPIRCEQVEVVGMTGESRTISPVDGTLTLALDDAPQYVHLCETETNVRLGLWRPLDSIQLLTQEGEGRVLVEVENPFYESLQGQLQVVVNGTILGEAWVQVKPGEEEKFSVPVTLEAPDGGIQPATVDFVTPDGLPLQSALVWLYPVR